MAIICVASSWDMSSTTSRSLPLSRQVENAAKVQVTNDDDGFLIDYSKERPAHVNVQHVIESALHLFQGTAWERCIEDLVQRKLGGSLDTAT